MYILILIGLYILGLVCQFGLYWVYFFLLGLARSYIARQELEADDLNLFAEHGLMASLIDNLDGLILFILFGWPLGIVLATAAFLIGIVVCVVIGIGHMFRFYFVPKGDKEKKLSFMKSLAGRLNRRNVKS